MPFQCALAAQVIYALFTITPETATGAGSDWLPVTKR